MGQKQARPGGPPIPPAINGGGDGEKKKKKKPRSRGMMMTENKHYVSSSSIDESLSSPAASTPPPQSTSSSASSPSVELPAMNRSDLTVVREVGQGTFGPVLEAEITAPHKYGAQTALLVLQEREEDADAFRQRVACAASTAQPALVRVIGCAVAASPGFAALENVFRGTLHHFLRISRSDPDHEEQASISVNEQIQICLACCKAVAYLHSQGVTADDVSAAAFFITSKLHVKLCNLGTGPATCPQNYAEFNGTQVPLRWLAPETLQTHTLEPASNVWMLGVTMWEVLSFAREPWTGTTDEEVVDLISSGSTLERPEACPEQVFEVMTSCWAPGPAHRPAAKHVASILSAIDALTYAHTFASFSNGVVGAPDIKMRANAAYSSGVVAPGDEHVSAMTTCDGGGDTGEGMAGLQVGASGYVDDPSLCEDDGDGEVNKEGLTSGYVDDPALHAETKKKEELTSGYVDDPALHAETKKKKGGLTSGYVDDPALHAETKKKKGGLTSGYVDDPALHAETKEKEGLTSGYVDDPALHAETKEKGGLTSGYVDDPALHAETKKKEGLTSGYVDDPALHAETKKKEGLTSGYVDDPALHAETKKKEGLTSGITSACSSTLDRRPQHRGGQQQQQQQQQQQYEGDPRNMAEPRTVRLRSVWLNDDDDDEGGGDHGRDGAMGAESSTDPQPTAQGCDGDGGDGGDDDNTLQKKQKIKKPFSLAASAIRKRFARTSKQQQASGERGEDEEVRVGTKPSTPEQQHQQHSQGEHGDGYVDGVIAPPASTQTASTTAATATATATTSVQDHPAQTSPVPPLQASDDASPSSDGDGTVEFTTNVRCVSLQRGPDGFGFVIKGNAPVTVTALDEGSAAEVAGLHVGDVFIALNGELVYFLSQKEVVARIKATGAGAIQLLVKTLTPEQLTQEAAATREENTRPRAYASLPYREFARAKREGSTFELFKTKLHSARALCLSPPTPAYDYEVCTGLGLAWKTLKNMTLKGTPRDVGVPGQGHAPAQPTHLAFGTSTTSNRQIACGASK
ncbi:TK protein kinase [Salpingoeca rosetta]|uniref:TK protein kinase n=1 Tax=Salpingoeca rosetta (strain ATCC 50818 / BSB-021) TaxID=946362 RepID=F2UIV2_SALR5|nr:TK protein kinase [Salpingoeca rosetta]EGD77151.1 TK protein kinase [Salpingoeca rosetta]|eukprot:XP_004990990.1 TK protein kinase [Salpingoeca rosetta]